MSRRTKQGSVYRPYHNTTQKMAAVDKAIEDLSSALKLPAEDDGIEPVDDNPNRRFPYRFTYVDYASTEHSIAGNGPVTFTVELTQNELSGLCRTLLVLTNELLVESLDLISPVPTHRYAIKF